MARPTPPDLPVEPANVMPVFTSRRKAEKLPSLRPAVQSKGLDTGVERGFCRRLARADWHRGFRWGVIATLGGVCLVAPLAVGWLK